MRKRIKKKDLKKDEFKETIQNLIIFYEHHQKTVIWSAIGIILAIIIILTYRNHRITTYNNARKEYNIGMVVYQSGKYQQAQQQFEMIKNQYWGTTFASKATYMLANIFYKQGEIDKALDNFEKFVNGEHDELFTPSAYQGIAQCYEQKGDFATAVEYCNKALYEFQYKTFKTDCLIQLGRLYTVLQRLEDAENAYREAIELTEDPTIEEKIERKLKSLEALREVSG